MGAYPTINLNDSIPAAPANGVNVEWQSSTSVHSPTIVNASAAIVGPGNNTQYLRADGTWDVPPGSGGGSVAGTNIITAAHRTSTTDNVGGYSVMVPMLAGAILSFAVTWKASLKWTTANVVIAGAVVYACAVDSTTITSATPVTFNSGATYPYTYGTAGGELFSDPINLNLDDLHDYYLVVYVTSGTLYVNTAVPPNQQSNLGCGYLLGNQVGLTTGGTVPNFTGVESDIYRILRVT